MGPSFVLSRMVKAKILKYFIAVQTEIIPNSGGPNQIFKDASIIQGAHYYLSFLLPAPINLGGTVFKGVYYSRKYGPFM